MAGNRDTADRWGRTSVRPQSNDRRRGEQGRADEIMERTEQVGMDHQGLQLLPLSGAEAAQPGFDSQEQLKDNQSSQKKGRVGQWPRLLLHLQSLFEEANNRCDHTESE